MQVKKDQAVFKLDGVKILIVKQATDIFAEEKKERMYADVAYS